ncbi:hypothetical protein SAMN04488527_11645 [Aliiroseovarius crassostreae]|nr:hypothetical protein [Aliiroseovarius crassostreae]SFU78299.1 hypothetical protein SAMN04488527_11645 [Aliiroseovarius crassostreae]
MLSLANQRYTSEVYARRFLNIGPDSSIVGWAENMVIAGFHSPHLDILLGELEPFNKFEMDALLDRIQRELKLPSIRSKSEALEIIATAYGRRFIAGKADSASTLFYLSELCIAERYANEIYDFYLLHFAAVDLAIDEIQYYWPDANRTNIEEIIRHEFISWLQNHPLTEWKKFEWDNA